MLAAEKKPTDMDGIGSRRIALLLGVMNHTAAPFDLDLSHVRPSVDGQFARTLRADELIRQAERRGAWKRFGNSLAGGVAAGVTGANAGAYQESGQVRGTITDAYGSAQYQGTYSASGYDAVAAQRASQPLLDRTAEANALSRQQQAAAVDTLRGELLVRDTIQPGEQITRTVVIEPSQRLRNGQQLLLGLSAGNEQHRLTLSYNNGAWTAHPQILVRSATAAAGVADLTPTTAAHPRASTAPSYGVLAPGTAIAESRTSIETSSHANAASHSNLAPASRITEHAISNEPASAAQPDPAWNTLTGDAPKVTVRPYLDIVNFKPADPGRGDDLARMTFSVHWTITPEGPSPKRIDGDLVFAGLNGVHLRIPWPLPSEGTELSEHSYWEYDTGFDIRNADGTYQ